MRFLINSTVGVAGTFDVAKSVGYPNHDNDFGMTLAKVAAKMNCVIPGSSGGPIPALSL